MPLKSLTTQELGTSLKRSNVRCNIDRHEAIDMTLVKENDPLPIVELKPFVQKVWRREKSLADKLERTRTVIEKVDLPQSLSENEKDLEVSPEVNHSYDVNSSTSSGIYNYLSQPTSSNRFVAFYVNAFEDFKSQKEHFHKFVVESGLRPKSKLHPIVDPKNRKQPEHRASIIPAFITRDERTKTTLQEILDGESTSRSYSCSPNAARPADVRKLREIRISGENIANNKVSPFENSPTPTKGIINGSWHGLSVRHGSPASMLFYNKTKHDRTNQRPKTPLYDYLDRSGVLPSLSINAKSLKKRESKNYEESVSDDYVDYSESFSSNAHNSIGGIENALMLLSKYGAPTKVERHISLELERNLSRFRKCKDYSPLEANPSELAKYYPPPTFNMTQGEIHIHKALQSNTWRKQRNVYSNSHENMRQNHFKMSGKANAFTNGPRRSIQNERDYIDSFASHSQQMYEYNALSKPPSYMTIGKDATNSAKTPNDEPIAPYDTPRSQVDNEASIMKLHEISVSEPSDVARVESQNETQNTAHEQTQSNFVKTVINKRNKKLASIMVREKSDALLKRSNILMNSKDVRGKCKDGGIYERQADNCQRSESDTLETTVSLPQNKINIMENDQEAIRTENQPVIVSAVTSVTHEETFESIDLVGKTFITSDNVQGIAAI